MKTREEILKEKYGFRKSSYKYIPKGAEILKSIGQIVIFVEYIKKEDGTWEDKYQKAKILEISKYDPMTMTYMCKYEVDGEKDPQELQIIPEGYSWGNPEETGWMKRFLPYSLHCQLVEDELFYSRLCELWEKRDTLNIEALKEISTSKEKDTQLRYSRHIAALLKLEDSNDILYFRVQDLSVRHKFGVTYNLRISDGENSYRMMVESTQNEYNFEGIGKLKIIDLCTN